MSADNYAYIDVNNLKVYECTASCVALKYKGKKDMLKKQCRFVKKAKNAVEAFKIAQKLDTEYGANFEPWCK